MDTTKHPEERPSPDHAKFAGALAKEHDQAYECANALFGLAQFAAWWTDFKKSECEGIEASFELKDNLKVEFFLKLSFYEFRFACDLTNLTLHLCDGHVLMNLQVGIWKLRQAATTHPESGQTERSEKMDSDHVAKGDPSEVPKRLFYVQGIIRNRLCEAGFYYPKNGALPLLAKAWRVGVSVELLESIAKSLDVRTWTDFRDTVYDAMDKASETDEEATRPLPEA